MDGMQPSPETSDGVAAASRRRRIKPILVLSALAVVVAIVAAWWFSGSGGKFGGQQSASLVVRELAQIGPNGAVVDDTTGNPVDPAGDGNAVCLPLSVATAVGLTGPNVTSDSAIKNGAQLAVDTHNAANPGCQVQLKLFDTVGDLNVAADTVPKIVEDPYTIGVIGPSSGAEVVAMGGLFRDAGIAAATPSATQDALSRNGWMTFFRGVASNGVQGLSVANYLKSTLGYDLVCIVDDGSDFGRELAAAVRGGLGSVARPDCVISMKVGNADVASAVSQLGVAAPDAIFYAGRYDGAADLAIQLKASGVTANFVAGGANDGEAFAERAGKAAHGTLLSCACATVTGVFADEYARRFGNRPAAFAAEAYDLATIMLRGIDRGINTRPALLDYLRTYDGQGVAGRYRWTESGELIAPVIWMYEVE